MTYRNDRFQLDNQRFSIGEVKELSTMIAERLAEMIQSGVLKPRERLVQTDLAEQFGVSRVAVRDALHKLIQRRLAVKIPRKGIIVRPVSCKIIQEQEMFAKKHALGETEEVELAQLIKKDWEFHMSIYDRCDNETLKDIIVELWSRMQQVQGLAQANVEWGEKWIKESATYHRQLLGALREREANKVEQLLTNTFAHVEEELIKALQEVRWVDSQNSIIGGKRINAIS